MLRLVVGVNCPPPRSDHRTRGWGSLVAVGPQSNFLGKNEILDRSSIVQDLLPGRIAVLFNLAEILGSEQNSNVPVSNNPISSRHNHALQGGFCHLPLRKHAISPDGFDAFGVKGRLGFIRGFIFKSHIALLCQKNAWEINLLPVGP